MSFFLGSVSGWLRIRSSGISTPDMAERTLYDSECKNDSAYAYSHKAHGTALQLLFKSCCKAVASCCLNPPSSFERN